MIDEIAEEAAEDELRLLRTGIYRSFVRVFVERTCADNIPPLVASRLAEPSQISPAIAKMVGEHEAFELAAAEIFEMNRPDRSRYRHLPASWFSELRSGLII